MVRVPLAGDVVNFKDSWSTVWSALTSGWPGLTTAMSVIGVVLVVVAVISWAWARRKGGNMSQGSDKIVGALIIGGLLSAPGLLIPLVLQILDWIINIGAKLIEKIGA